MAKLADAADLNSAAPSPGRTGSNPVPGTRPRRAWRRLAAAAACGAVLAGHGGAAAQPAEAAASAAPSAASAPPAGEGEPDDATLVRRLMVFVTPRFSTQLVPRLGPELQQQVDELASEHLQRVRERLAAYLAEERQRPSPVPLERRGQSWLAHEHALWRVDSLGAEDDAMQRRLLSSPFICRHNADPTPFRFVIAQIQALPVPERAKALDFERQRLARWGQPRGRLPDWPVPMPDVQIAAAVDAALRGAVPADPPLPSSIRRAYWRDDEVPTTDNLARACEAAGWWLQQAGAPPQALDLVRLALMPRARRGVSGVPRRPGEYPPAAALHGVEGTVTVEMDVDADGLPQRPRIVQRSVSVPGLRDRPIAHETLFDDASLVRVRAMRFDAARGRTHRVELAWTLPRDGSAPR